MEWLDTLVKDIQESIGDRHISTILYGEIEEPPYNVLVVTDDFSVMVVEKLASIGARYRDKGLEGPYLIEYGEVRGMGDSLPEEIIEAVMNYRVLAGRDIFKDDMLVDREHMRAQAEMMVRHYLFTLRWALINLYTAGIVSLRGYLKSVRFYIIQAGSIYYRIKGEPGDMGSSNILARLMEEFDATAEINTLERLAASGGGEKEELVAAAIDAIEKVLKGMLMEIDRMGRL